MIILTPHSIKHLVFWHIDLSFEVSGTSIFVQCASKEGINMVNTQNEVCVCVSLLVGRYQYF